MYSLRVGGGRASLLMRGQLARSVFAPARCCACHAAASRDGRRASHAAAESSGKTFLVLERAVAARAGVDRELWHDGRFNAMVYPDLPVAASWLEFLSSLLSRRGEQGDLSAQLDGRLDNRLLTRGRSAVRRRLHQAASEGANAVLCLSGSHPAHRLAAASGWSPTSFELLRTASAMRQQGELPKEIELWAVENPLLNPPDRLQQKLEAGASVILTQPPLLWDRFAAWRGLTQQAKLVVGVPMLTSPGNARFWLQLCRAASLEGAAQLVQDFQQAESGGKAELAAFSQAYNKALIAKALALPGVRGLHIMPLTRPARSQVLALQQDGIIPQPL